MHYRCINGFEALNIAGILNAVLDNQVSMNEVIMHIVPTL